MEKEELINILKDRFNANLHRHKNTSWEVIEDKLNNNNKLYNTVQQMEDTLGSPDVLEYNNNLYYVDFSVETPNRRSLCYDKDALDKRKKNKPLGDVISLATSMGLTILNEEEYRYIQQLDDLDLKTSSWILTPDDFRSLGGAKTGEKRYNEVFIYHNGADSYYSSRAFRGKIEIK